MGKPCAPVERLRGGPSSEAGRARALCPLPFPLSRVGWRIHPTVPLPSPSGAVGGEPPGSPGGFLLRPRPEGGARLQGPRVLVRLLCVDPAAPYRRTVRVAKQAHRFYSDLVRIYDRHGYNTRVGRITHRQLNRAANAAADLIATMS